ncbi:uncharacterized protein LOC112341474 isoform X4 [Selaginella moellendorffii]|uniref:uncharacterized protein LOC112341474 isoform X4 n=1 Tax=Selaginella moellendorffii TaxID=88036 RepID=UPI000D1CE942|nr:uncharacterized protein LOC112341474 isoform X4 [Selaginella moellendorffii]|eukprot:XP_024517388.1 uncharacterized protein LOC112341474 isoform X4 [Selaginella moellendorffii]
MALRGSTNDVSIHDIKEGFDVEKLKTNVAKAYLTYHEIPDVGLKHELLRRIRDHIKCRKCGTLRDSYPPSSFVLPCDGVVCPDDVILFKSSMNSTVAARVLSVSRQCRKFTLDVLWSEGMAPYKAFHHYSFPWQKIGQLQSTRQPAEDEDLRKRNAKSIQSQFLKLAEQEKASDLTRKQLRPERVRNKAKNSTARDEQHSRGDGAGPSTAIVEHVAQREGASTNADPLTAAYPSSGEELEDDGDPGLVLDSGDRQPLEAERRTDVEKRRLDQEAGNACVPCYGDDGAALQTLEGEERRNQDAETAAGGHGKRRRLDDGNEMYTSRVLNFDDSEPVDKNLKVEGRKRILPETRSELHMVSIEDEKTMRARDGNEMYTGRVLNFDDNEPVDQNLKAEGRKRNLPESEAQVHMVSNEDKKTMRARDGNEMYTGRMLNFDDNEPVVLNLEGEGAKSETPREVCSEGRKRKRDKELNYVSEMYTEPIDRIGAERRKRKKKAESEGPRHSPLEGKRRKRNNESKPYVFAGPALRFLVLMTGGREMYSGRILYFGDSERVVQNCEVVGRNQEAEGSRQSGKRKKLSKEPISHMYTGRVINFTDCEPGVEIKGRRKNQSFETQSNQETHGSKSKRRDQDARSEQEHARHKGKTKKLNRKGESEERNAYTAGHKVDNSFEAPVPAPKRRKKKGMPFCAVLKLSSLTWSSQYKQALSNKPVDGPRSTPLYKQRPDWEKKWNPQCHVKCVGCKKNNASKICVEKRCCYCCKSSRCGRHTSRRKV